MVPDLQEPVYPQNQEADKLGGESHDWGWGANVGFRKFGPGCRGGIQRPLRQPGLSGRAWSPQGHNPSGPRKVGKAGRGGEHHRGVVKVEAAWPKGEKTGCVGGIRSLAEAEGVSVLTDREDRGEQGRKTHCSFFEGPLVKGDMCPRAERAPPGWLACSEAGGRDGGNPALRGGQASCSEL